jgi:putative acetyltransferase
VLGDKAWQSSFSELFEVDRRMRKTDRNSMTIRRMIPEDRDELLRIWRRSVDATHHFVSAQDLDTLTPQVQHYLAQTETQFWVYCDSIDRLLGFMGLKGNRMESLFLDPACFRQGAGRQMVLHAQELWDELLVDVNEQNGPAVAFYEACGFRVIGRSETDDQERPYPLLHMKLVRATESVSSDHAMG